MPTTARYWLLQSLIPLGRYAEAAPIAEKLRDAREAKYRVAAEYFRAFLLEKRGQAAAARSEYERFLILHPDSDLFRRRCFRLRSLRLRCGIFRRLRTDSSATPSESRLRADAPRALYLAMQSGCFGGDREVVDKALKLLDSRFPDSAAGIESRLQLADYLETEGDGAAAETQLAELEKRGAAKNPEVAAEILYRRAKISASSGKTAEAMAQLETLLEKFPAGPFAADAAMMAGNLEADAGHYAAALAFYTKARELRPEGLFGRVAAGRIADMRYSIYAETLDPADLKAAAGAV